MKCFCIVVGLVLFQYSSLALAQNKYNSWQFTLGVNYLNYINNNQYVPNIQLSPLLSIFRDTHKGFASGLRFTLSQQDNISTKKSIFQYAGDYILKYHINRLIKMKSFDPTLAIGGGYVYANKQGSIRLLVDISLQYWITHKVGIASNATYYNDFLNKGFRGFQVSTGISFRLGGEDKDTHIKNISIDSRDPEELQSHSDIDADGILDKDDKCPKEKGDKKNFGCPWIDTDADGIPDKDDKCPNKVGAVVNDGCPEKVTEILAEEINLIAEKITFEGTEITPSTKKYLYQILGALNLYETSDYYLELKVYSGDFTQSDNKNIALSMARGNTIKQFFVKHKLNVIDIDIKGYLMTNDLNEKYKVLLKLL